MELSKSDPTSYANTEDFVIENAYFNWQVNFSQEAIVGYVEYGVRTVNMKANTLILDSNKIKIEEVLIDGENVVFHLRTGDIWGYVEIPVGCKKEKFSLKITYSTTEECTALQWLSPSMTLGKKHPYLFSQCQAVHARSLVPCQDTPAIKFSFRATVEAPKDVQVLMGAVKISENDIGEHRVHKFEQKIPIPSYLLAIASGDLKGVKIGSRCTVWSEPEMVDKAAWEFAEMEEMLNVAESICGPYEWGVYDVLVLPPSFPYGGMENPCLTFVTPCLISGDRSQVHVIAHEMAHSWTGNLVTNTNWDHFWINEGHTRYLERLILESHQSSSDYRHLNITAGLAELRESLDAFNEIYGSGHEFCKLVPHLVGLDPDDAFSRVPYEKGSFLLFYLENLVGKEQMLRWLKTYIAKYRLKSLSTDEWKKYFIEYMTTVEKVDPKILSVVDWQTWFHGTDYVPVDTDGYLNQSMVRSCNELADLWVNRSEFDDQARAELKERYESMIIDQKFYFFRILINVRKVALPAATLKLMEHLYELNETKNSEIRYGWSCLCLRSHYEDALDHVFDFVSSNGRLMYNKPIYRLLYEWNELKEKATCHFKEREHTLHPVTQGELKKILRLS